MSDLVLHERDAWNVPRFSRGLRTGHYESWFLRANHPTRPLAFWIRYTIFCPKGRPDDAVGELWAVLFDGELDRAVAVKEDIPIRDCLFRTSGLDLRLGSATLTGARACGRATSGGHTIGWSLDYSGGLPPLLLLPPAFYERGFPKAKAIVPLPNAVFHGTIALDGEDVAIEGWRGSQNHNWGSRHTDSYAWGQVAGFDHEAEAFLECSTAQVKIGPLWTPRMSFVVLRTEGEEFAFHTMAVALRAAGAFGFFDWKIDASSSSGRVTVHIHAPREAFAALTYRNPPGGSKTCLNSKIATCEVTLHVAGRPPRTLRAERRAAFEILTDRRDHGVPVAV